MFCGWGESTSCGTSYNFRRSLLFRPRITTRRTTSAIMSTTAITASIAPATTPITWLDDAMGDVSVGEVVRLVDEKPTVPSSSLVVVELARDVGATVFAVPVEGREVATGAEVVDEDNSEWIHINNTTMSLIISKVR